MIEQSPRPFIIMGDFNNHNDSWGSKKTDKKDTIIESLLSKNQLYMHNNRTNTYPHPAKATYSVIDLTTCDPKLFLDYDWKVHDDTCGSDHFPIILQNMTNNQNKRTPSWNLKKVNWGEIKISCLIELIPEANKNKEENLLYFTNALLNVAESHIPKVPTPPKHNRPWFNEECQKAVRLHRAELKKFKINATRGKLNNYKNGRAKARNIIKDSKRSTSKN